MTTALLKTALKADLASVVPVRAAAPALAVASCEPVRSPTIVSSRVSRLHFATLVGAVATAALLGLLPIPAAAQATAPGAAATTAPSSTEPQVAKSREEWSAAMAKLPVPKNGCFTSAFPRIEWIEVPCKPPVPYPQPPSGSGASPNTVGGRGGVDFSVHVPGLLVSATGSFDSISAGVSETGTNPTTHTSGVANTYTLQLNTKPLPNNALCKDAATPSQCTAWQQFLYDSAAPGVYMQYWLINYGMNCPSGWTFYLNDSSQLDCYQSTSVSTAPALTIADLSQVSMVASTVAGGSDTLKLTTGMGQPITATAQDSILNLADYWQDAEFNIFGDGYGTAANFGSNTTITVRTSIDDGTVNAPHCSAETYTGETNNLSLVKPCCPYGPYNGAAPAIAFTQSNKAGETAVCANGTSIGDTHLATVYGLAYDFQASGDFVLVETDHDFMVQTRQQSGAPRWPNAAVNKAIAVRLGETRVAVCLEPTQLEVNGRITDLADGKTLRLPGTVEVSRLGDVYVIKRGSGETVTAQLNAPTSNGWIDVWIDVGKWPEATTRGLLGNGNDVVDQIATRFGTPLREPVSFTDLYHRYAESWRVPEDESMICKGQVKPGIPEQPFYADDLNPKEVERARAICTAAGVTQQTWLDACILDTTVLGNATAAKVFTRLPAPRAVMRPAATR